MPTRGPTVTVLMPTYNRPETLREAVRSVVEQSFGDWELLVINDGGAEVGPIVRSFGDRRIVYVSRPANRGKAACLNAGLARARGRYIAYLDDDDRWYPNHLATLCAALREHPEAQAVYSDLYEVLCLKGPGGRRHPLQKRIQVCRDYNRMFMFHFNHVFHVSLMHERDLALRAGGYDERVRVLIDWDLSRKLSFYTDFVHVPAITGEYYVPLTGSDRISDREREREETYRQNLRRIRADLPPEPWPMVDRVAVVLPVHAWDEETRRTVAYFADRLDHPCRIVLVNRDRRRSAAACRRALGTLGDLGHVRVVSAPTDVPNDEEQALYDAYLAGARQVEADFYYLPTPRLNRDLPLRLIRAVCHLHETGCEAVRWRADRSAGPYDVMLTRDALLGAGRPFTRRPDLDLRPLPADELPRALEADYWLNFATLCEREGDYVSAQNVLARLGTVRQGGLGNPYLAQLYARIDFATGNFAASERMCRRLIAAGYGADNWVRLGRICQHRGDYAKALDAYRSALEAIGLTDADLESPAFPLSTTGDSDAFSAMMGWAECLLALGRHGEAAPVLRRAALLRNNSPRPYLGFGRLFLAEGDPVKAAEALSFARLHAGSPPHPEVEDALAEVYERSGHLSQAWDQCLKVLRADPTHERALLRARRLAERLGHRAHLATLYENRLAHRPGDVRALAELAALRRDLGQSEAARSLATAPARD